MSKGSEAEVTRLQVESQGMVQFDHIWRDTEGDMRMEMRIEVWGGKAWCQAEEFGCWDSLYTPTSNLCTRTVTAFESELCPQFQTAATRQGFDFCYLGPMSLHADLLSRYKSCERHWNTLFSKISLKEPIWEALHNGPHLSIITFKSREIALTVVECAVSCVPYTCTIVAGKKEARVEIFIYEVGGGEKERKNAFLNHCLGWVGIYMCQGFR